MGRKHGTDMHQQSFVAQMTALGYLLAPPHVLVVAGHADPQHPALHTDRPHSLVALDEGVPHFCPLAKYAVAFPRMSRSMVTRANSARRRLISICSAITCALPAAHRSPARCALIELPSVCSTTPNVRATDAALWPTEPAGPPPA